MVAPPSDKESGDLEWFNFLQRCVLANQTTELIAVTRSTAPFLALLLKGPPSKAELRRPYPRQPVR